jgi:CRP-like cAMP-binding protein
MPDSEAAERLEKLRAIPLFAHLPQEALKRVLDCATEFEAERGHVLMQPNRPGAGLFVIEEGTVEVELPNRKIELGPGEFVGELALLDEHAISRDDFDRLLKGEPEMAVSMLKVVATRLSRASRKLASS